MSDEGELAKTFDFFMTEGWTRHLQGDKNGTVECFQRAVSLNPRSSVAVKSRGIAHLFLGRRAAAAGDFVRALTELEENFNHASKDGVYPYTKRSEEVYRSILRACMPVILLDESKSGLMGSEFAVDDQIMVRAKPSAHPHLALALPGFCARQIETILDQTVHARISFTPTIKFSSVNSRSGIHITLKLNTASFGVYGCLGTEADDRNHGNLLGFVVYGLRIVASPGEAWKSDCRLSNVRPGDEHNSHPLQHTQGTGYQAVVNVSPIAIPTATFQANYSDATTRTSPACGWLPSSKGGPHENENAWTSQWVLLQYKDGSKVELEKPLSKIPKLPFQDPCNVNYSSLQTGCFDATWDVPLTLVKRLDCNLDFKITIQADIVLLPRWRWRESFSPPKPVTETVEFSEVIHCQFSDSAEQVLINYSMR